MHIERLIAQKIKERDTITADIKFLLRFTETEETAARIKKEMKKCKRLKKVGAKK